MTTAERRLIDAAIGWWERHRPLSWGEDVHLRYPAINTCTASEGTLANAVAALLASRARKRKVRR